LTPVEVALLLFSWVFFLSLGFALGFYWLETQLEDQMVGMLDFSDDGLDLSEELEELDEVDLE